MTGHLVGVAGEVAINFVCENFFKTDCSATAYTLHEILIEPVFDSLVFGQGWKLSIPNIALGAITAYSINNMNVLEQLKLHNINYQDLYNFLPTDCIPDDQTQHNIAHSIVTPVAMLIYGMLPNYAKISVSAATIAAAIKYNEDFHQKLDDSLIALETKWHEYFDY